MSARRVAFHLRSSQLDEPSTPASLAASAVIAGPEASARNLELVDPLSSRIHPVDDVGDPTGIGVDIDDDQCPSIASVSAEDVVVAMCHKVSLGISTLVATAPVLRPHDCK
jgi:hypothetical protein